MPAPVRSLSSMALSTNRGLMDRREFLWTSGAAALALPFLSASAARAVTPAPSPAVATAGDAALDALFERIFQEQVRTSPLAATFLGMDKGELAPLKSKLDTRPDQQAQTEEVARTNKFIGWLDAVPEAGLSPAARLNREVVLWDLKMATSDRALDISNRRPVFDQQQDGAYFSIRISQSAHRRESADARPIFPPRQFATGLKTNHDYGAQAARASCPGWSLDWRSADAPAARSAATQGTMADFGLQPCGAKNIAGLECPRARCRWRSIRRSTARSPRSPL